MATKQARWTRKPPLGTPLGSGPLHRGLVGFWPLNERAGARAFDLSRMRNTGTHTDVAWSSMQARESVLFNNTTSKIVLDATKFPTGYPLTFACWMRSTNAGASALTPISYTNSAASTSRIMFEFPNGDGPNGIYWNVRNGGSEVEITYNVNGDGLWHFAVGVSRAANDHELFVDGVSRATSTTSVTFPTLDAAGIGYRNSPGGDETFFDGHLDLPMVWNRALTAAEVWTLYTQPYALFAPPAQWWSEAVFVAPAGDAQARLLGGDLLQSPLFGRLVC